MSSFLFFYRFFFFPIFFLIFKLLSYTHPKIKKGFLSRKGSPWLHFPKSLCSPILIHCASGEFEYAKSVICEIKNQNPQSQVVVTYFSPTYEKQIREFPQIDFSCPLPWDFASTQKTFLKNLKPSQILIARTDLWPEFLNQANNFKIPVSLFSATLSQESSKLKNPFLKSYLQWIFSYIKHVYCVSPDDKISLSQIISEDKVTPIGDTRYDQVLNRIQNPKPLKKYLQPKEKCLIIGSSWPEDEKVLFPIFSKVLQNQIAIIIAPHEPTPHHLLKIKEALLAFKIECDVYSSATFFDSQKVLIIDQVGILADLYSWATWAFVGGSFKKTVHSVMEPLAHGCLTYFGPYYQNNREAIEFYRLGLANSFQKDEEFVNSIIESQKNLSLKKEQILNEIKKRQGSSKVLVQLLFKNQN